MTARNLAIEALYAGQEARTFSERLKAHALGRAAIAALEAETGEPVDCQFQGTDGRWHSFVNDQHKDDTIASGKWPIRNLYAAPLPAVPPGWKLVPIEPTPEMWKAGLAHLFRDIDAVWRAMLAEVPEATGSAVSQWIPVTERLPATGMLVIVRWPASKEDWTDDDRIGFDHISADYEDWNDHCESFDHYMAVGGSGAAGPDSVCTGPSQKAPYTHWMPLPEAPK